MLAVSALFGISSHICSVINMCIVLHVEWLESVPPSMTYMCIHYLNMCIKYLAYVSHLMGIFVSGT